MLSGSAGGAAYSRGSGDSRGWRSVADVQSLANPTTGESVMSNQKKAAQGSAATASTKKYKSMTQAEKSAYIGKVFLFLLTFGFAYPSILLD
jgi:hypothetical protein